MGTRETLKAIHDRGDGELFRRWASGDPMVQLTINKNPIGPKACLNFSDPPDDYQFRVITLRPWTPAEAWIYRDSWFRLKGYPSAEIYRPDVYNPTDGHMRLGGVYQSPAELLKTKEWSQDGVTWHPCGVNK